jgi:NAD dependent epimerase/dehydratase family enzyme
MQVPEKGLQVLFGDMSQVLLSSQRVLPKATVTSRYEFVFPDLGQALKHLLG